MATSNKAQDPAAAALLAIEEALNLSADAPAADENKAPEVSTPGFPKPPSPTRRRKSCAVIRKGRRLAHRPSVRKNVRCPACRRSRNIRSSRPRSPTMAKPRGRVISLPHRRQSSRRPRRRMMIVILSVRCCARSTSVRARRRCSSPESCLCSGSFSSGFYFGTHRADLLASGAAALRPQIALFAIVAFGPVIFFVVTALLARRAQEMRLTAR